MRRYPESRGSCRKWKNSRNAISVPRLHDFDCVRFAIDRIADWKAARQASRNYSGCFERLIWGIACRNNSRRAFGCGCRKGARSEAYRRALANSRRTRNHLLVIFSIARGSFRLSTQPSSTVVTSCTSPLCAQTTARAPWSSGAFRSSS
jgi:hypothetical protein